MISAFHKIETSLTVIILLVIISILAVVVAFLHQRTKKETSLKTAAKLALADEKAKTQFLTVISHELRTPLNGIIGIADLLSRTAPTDVLRKQIGIINDSGHDLLKLVEQVLDMSRIDAQEMDVFPEYTNLADIVSGLDRLWRTTIEKKSIIFTSYIDPKAPEFVMVDPLRLRQCINNLLSNSAKFTKKGRIHLHVTADLNSDSDIALIKIIVADTGIGISRSVQDNLFKPFVQADSSITRQYGGSGLGLSITRSLARMMKGDLTVTSKENAGTEFTLTLRARAKEEQAELAVCETHTTVAIEIQAAETTLPQPAQRLTTAHEDMSDVLNVLDDTDREEALTLTEAVNDIIVDASALKQPNDARLNAPAITDEAFKSETYLDKLEGLKVLIVEDVPSNQHVLKIFLEPEGCMITSTANGKEALEAASQQNFDVILMDIRMPEMDGIQATRIIRARAGANATVPIIALTADATAETNAECMAAGADIFLTKPIVAQELLNAIRFVRRQAQNRAKRALKSA